MTRAEISAVTHLRLDENLIRAAHLDYPRVGPVDGHAFEVNGWVVGTMPVRAIEFVQNRWVVARSVPTVPRPDVANRYPVSEPPGFWRAIGTVGFVPDFTVRVRAVLADGRSSEFAEIRGRQRLTSASRPALRPLMLSSLGRSGSTWLMRMLAEHPDVLVHARHPYETRVCSYWMHFLKVLAEPLDPATRPQPFDFYLDRRTLAQFPYYFANPDRHAVPPEQAAIDHWYGGQQVEQYARIAQDTVESFYREYATARGVGRPVFFAEKSAPADHCAWLIWQLYPRAREIFLIRDARDILASVLAFNRRRGFDSFGRERVDSDEEYVEVVRADMLSLARQWRARSRRAVLVRYEDLLRKPREQVRALLDALELDAADTIVDSMVSAGAEATAAVIGHRTAPDGPSSIGRWAHDLTPTLRELCDETLAELTDEFTGES